ncbi:MAG TPA: trehalose-phosphatase, partial [Polyangiales bacterium]
MKDLLSHGAESLLQRYAWSNTLLAFDFDGTLAPIVARAETAQMRATTRTKLTALAQLYPCVVISGRGLADVRQRLAGVPLAAVVGNHGLEPSQRMVDHARTAREWLPRLQQRLRVEPGVEIEDKRYSLAIHYRRSRSKRLAHLLITLAVAELCPDARSIAGKQVVNVVPPGAPHKGIALERLREDTHTD